MGANKQHLYAFCKYESWDIVGDGCLSFVFIECLAGSSPVHPATYLLQKKA